MAKIMKDGKPSTSFSRQDREWVKAMGGGSGSSDFSVAEVTITNSSTDGYILFPCIGAEYGGVMEDWNTMEIQMVNPDPDAQNFKIPVYKDGTLLMVEGNPPYTITVTGSITEDNGTITVTGDGTIIMSNHT